MSSGIISGFALSAFMSVAPTNMAYADPTQEAMTHLGKACVKQFKLDAYANEFEKRYINKEVRKYGGYIGIGIRMATEQKISYKWTF